MNRIFDTSMFDDIMQNAGSVYFFDTGRAVGLNFLTSTFNIYYLYSTALAIQQGTSEKFNDYSKVSISEHNALLAKAEDMREKPIEKISYGRIHYREENVIASSNPTLSAIQSVGRVLRY